jgi:tRNA(Ile)-lysidine synthase
MLHVNRSLLRPKLNVAVSGGVDSMVVLDFLGRSRRAINAIYVNHCTQYSYDAEDFVRQYCTSRGINFNTKKINPDKPANRSQEDWWREERYKILEELSDGNPVVTAHHANDAMETWVFSCLDWAKRKEVPFVEDPSNSDIRYTRNYIRRVLLPAALHVNPGLLKTIIKKYRK